MKNKKENEERERGRKRTKRRKIRKKEEQYQDKGRWSFLPFQLRTITGTVLCTLPVT